MIRVVIFLIVSVIANVIDAHEEIPCSAENRETCDPCGITGKWKNDLGSEMTITCEVDSLDRKSTGEIKGKYNSAVGNAEDFYPLLGRFTMAGPDLKNCILGFTVAYNNAIRGNSNSTASFTGVYFKVDDTIYTHWILASNTEHKDMWRNSNIGNNVFTRIANL